MSLHVGAVMVRGDARAFAPDLFRLFGYQPVGVVTRESWDTAAPEAFTWPVPDKPRTLVRKIVVVSGEWTVVVDPELVMPFDEEALSTLAGRLGTPVFSMICEGASNTYAFSMYDHALLRAFMSTDGERVDDRGQPLAQEQGLDLDSIWEDDVLAVMKRVGVDYDQLEAVGPYDVWELDESGFPSVKQPAPEAPAARITGSRVLTLLLVAVIGFIIIISLIVVGSFIYVLASPV